MTPPVLVGDIGGSNTRLAVHDGALRQVRAWPTDSCGGLGETLARYRAETGARWAAACVAVAGPVSGATVSLTNADWTGHLSDFGAPACFANDLEAAAWSLEDLGEAVVQLRGGPRDPAAPAAVLGLGTGLGEAYRVGEAVLPGEGGHRPFSPDDDEQRALAAWLRRVEGRRPTWEHVLSGDGLGRITAFLAGRPDTTEARALSFAATQGAHPQADAAQALYARCCAAEARAQALQVLAGGGVWLVGGMPGRVAARHWERAFQERFVDEGAHRGWLEGVPVYRVTHPHTNLVGAARLARRLLAAG